MILHTSQKLQFFCVWLFMSIKLNVYARSHVVLTLLIKDFSLNRISPDEATTFKAFEIIILRLALFIVLKFTIGQLPDLTICKHIVGHRFRVGN